VLRIVGVLLFLASLALPVHGCVSHPRDFETLPTVRRLPTNVRVVPRRATDEPVKPGWKSVADLAREGAERQGLWGALWESRAWYPYYLGPLWLAALLAARAAPRARGAVARGLLMLSGAVAGFEFLYLWSDYDGFLPKEWWKVEKVLAWFAVCLVLFWRPARRLDSIGATVSAQALLAFLHAWVFPLQDVRFWTLQGHGPGAMLRAISKNYHAGYWLALAALALVALPGYLPLLRRRRPVANATGGAGAPAAVLAEPEPVVARAADPASE
jgi:hypothetical protein